MDPKQVVRDGYDTMAERHAAWAQGIRLEERARYTQVLLDGLPAGARVLDSRLRGGPAHDADPGSTL